MTNKNTYSLGCIEDLADTNDLMLSSYIIPRKLPKAVSWFDPSIPILNQGNEPSCVGYSSVNLKREQEKIEMDKILNFSGQDLYARCKKVDGIPNLRGTYIRVAMKILQKEGVKDSDGNVYKIGAYTKVSNLQEMKYAILANGYAVIGINVLNSFYNPINGIIDLKENDSSNGGHAIIIGAFDDTVERVVCKNTWGEDWGIGGYAYISYKYIEKNMHTGWTSVDVKNENTQASGILNIGKIVEDLDNLKK